MNISLSVKRYCSNLLNSCRKWNGCEMLNSEVSSSFRSCSFSLAEEAFHYHCIDTRFITRTEATLAFTHNLTEMINFFGFFTAEKHRTDVFF